MYNYDMPLIRVLQTTIYSQEKRKFNIATKQAMECGGYQKSICCMFFFCETISFHMEMN